VVKERKTNYVEVLVSEVSPELHVYVQPVSEGPKLESLMDNLRKQLDSNPPIAGSYSPKQGNILNICYLLILTRWLNNIHVC